MSSKLQLLKPTLFMVYGYPGSGKSYYCRQMSQELQSAHVNSERIRLELFDEPRYDKQENDIIKQIMLYMTEEYLSAGLSVMFDSNLIRTSQRREIKELARKLNVESILIWFQIDADSAFDRVMNRDKRKLDDKYSIPLDKAGFENYLNNMQNPNPIDNYVVVSGKHTFKTQFHTIIKRLYDQGLLQAEQTSAGRVKPGLTNLVPNPLAGRVDPSRRNISIRN